MANGEFGTGSAGNESDSTFTQLGDYVESIWDSELLTPEEKAASIEQAALKLLRGMGSGQRHLAWARADSTCTKHSNPTRLLSWATVGSHHARCPGTNCNVRPAG